MLDDSSEGATSPLTIALLISGLGDGGAQKQFAFLANALSLRDDVRVIVIRNVRGVHDDLLDESRVECRWLNLRSNYDPRVIVRVARILRRERVDVLFSWLQASDVPAFFARMLAPRSIWVLAERDSAYPRGWRFELRKLLGKRADSIIANSAAGESYWRRLGYRGSCEVVPNIVPLSLRKIGARAALDPSALYVGRLEPQKNVITMMQAFRKLFDADSRWRFEIAGQGSLRSEMESVVSGKHFVFHGFLRDVESLMLGSSILVSVSRHEGMPNVLLEGVARGLVPVVSKIPEHIAVLGDDYPFYVEEYDSADAIVAVIRRVADSSEDFDAVLEPARVEISRMSPELVSTRYLEIFQNILARRRHAIPQSVADDA